MIDLIIHLGHSKCGSSTIQGFLYSNCKALSERKIGLVSKDLRISKSTSAQDAPVQYFEKLKQKKYSLSSFERDFTQLAEFAENGGYKRIILSAENLGDEVQARFFEVVSDLNLFTFHGIYYVRRQDDWLLSSWKQWQVKLGVSLEEYIARQMRTRYFRFKTTITAWTQVFGDEFLSVRYLNNSSLTGGNLLQDFCSALAIDREGLAEVQSQNSSLDYDLLHALSTISFVFRDRHDNKLYDYIEKEFHQELSGKNQNPLSAQQRNEIIQAYQEENSWLKSNFFPRANFDDWIKIDWARPYTHIDPIRGLTLLNGVLLKAVLPNMK